MKILVVDIGGKHVKCLASGQVEARQFPSGPRLTPLQMMDEIKRLVRDWQYDVVTVGYPGLVIEGRVAGDPPNLASGWTTFNFPRAFGRPVRLMNDASMQALGSYRGGRMLFLGIGTGFGSTLIVNGIVEPLELGMLPYRKGTLENYIGREGLERFGHKKWQKHINSALKQLKLAFLLDDIVIGGGLAKEVGKLPPGCRHGSNANAFVGGFRMWEDAGEWQSSNYLVTHMKGEHTSVSH